MTDSFSTPPASRNQGVIIVISGPSGVGKGTLCKRLLERRPGLALSVSATTRPMRPGEVDGESYHFKTRSEFQAMIDQGELVEWAEYAANLYGTPKSSLQTAIDAGQTVLLEIEVQGALQVKQLFAEQAKLIFILPPSLEVLADRLKTRGTNTDDDMATRLKWAEAELAQVSAFDYTVVNDTLDESTERLLALIAEISPENQPQHREAAR